jgi:uncharacterized protein YbjT (DUF2867 family)
MIFLIETTGNIGKAVLSALAESFPELLYTVRAGVRDAEKLPAGSLPEGVTAVNFDFETPST